MSWLGSQRRPRWAARTAGLAVLLLLLHAPAPLQAGAAERTTLLPLGQGTRATGMVSGPDGNLWFVGFRYGSPPVDFRNVVGQIEPSGGVREFPLSNWPNPRGGEIAVGPEGNLWFTETDSGTIGRITVAGAISEYPLGNEAAAPTAIAAGPGGLWFVEEAAAAIGRIDAGGTITEFALPPGSRPSGIVKGSDGAMWFTEQGRARIGRINAAGAISGYALPDPGAEPHAIIASGDDLWFTDESGPRLGRISTAGVLDDFPVPSDHGTRELTLAADGNLWFSTGNAIGSIAPSGETGEPACVQCSLPITTLAKGPDGQPWFGTGIREAGGGGGTQLPELYASGFAGRFVPPPLEAVLGRRPSRVDDGLTTVSLSCHGGSAGTACRGWLRLTARLPRGKGRRGKATVLLDQHRYRLQPATGRRLPLALGPRGRRALARGKRLRVEISATLIDATGSKRDFVLRARGRR